MEFQGNSKHWQRHRRIIWRVKWKYWKDKLWSEKGVSNRQKRSILASNVLEMRHIQGRKTNNKLSSNKLPVIQLKLKKMERKKKSRRKRKKRRKWICYHGKSSVIHLWGCRRHSHLNQKWKMVGKATLILSIVKRCLVNEEFPCCWKEIPNEETSFVQTSLDMRIPIDHILIYTWY